MQKIIYGIGMALLLFAPTLARAEAIDTLFAKVPRRLLPMLDRTSRLDLLDLYNNKLPAKADNIYGGQSQLLQKTSDYLLVKTTDVGTWQMKLLPIGHDTLISCIYSVKAGGISSQIFMLQRNWQQAKHEAPTPTFEQFYIAKNPLSPLRAQIMQSTLRQVPIEMTWSDSTATLTYSLSLNGLCEEDQNDAAQCVRQVLYQWNEGKFSPIIASKSP